MDTGPMGMYQMFNRPHGMIGGMMDKPNGGTILNGPMEVPGGDWVANAMDPQGAAFSLHAKKA